jgi:hypothetical protein
MVGRRAGGGAAAAGGFQVSAGGNRAGNDEALSLLLGEPVDAVDGEIQGEEVLELGSGADGPTPLKKVRGRGLLHDLVEAREKSDSAMAQATKKSASPGSVARARKQLLHAHKALEKVATMLLGTEGGKRLLGAGRDVGSSSEFFSSPAPAPKSGGSTQKKVDKAMAASSSANAAAKSAVGTRAASAKSNGTAGGKKQSACNSNLSTGNYLKNPKTPECERKGYHKDKGVCQPWGYTHGPLEKEGNCQQKGPNGNFAGPKYPWPPFKVTEEGGHHKKVTWTPGFGVCPVCGSGTPAEAKERVKRFGLLGELGLLGEAGKDKLACTDIKGNTGRYSEEDFKKLGAYNYDWGMNDSTALFAKIHTILRGANFIKDVFSKVCARADSMWIKGEYASRKRAWTRIAS